MNQNKVYKNFQKFALEQKSFSEFMGMLKETNAGNTMFIRWRTAVSPTHRTSHNMYWGKFFSNSDQSITKEEEGMVNLVAPDTAEGWRTLTYENISSFSYKGKTYRLV